MGLFSFIGGLFGGGSQKKAIDQATKAQVDAFNRGIDEQRRQYDDTVLRYKPVTDMLAPTATGLGNLTGINGNDEQGAAIQSLLSSPYYQSLFANGQEALNQNAAATGGIRGGNFARASMDFGRDTLAQTIQQQLANLGGIAGLATGATDSVAGFGANKANAVTGLLGNIGGAQASGALARGRVNSQMWNSAGGFLDQAVSMIPGLGGIAGGKLAAIMKNGPY